MHAPGPWALVRSETPEYYVYEINAAAGHVASIPGWTHFGTICPVTDGNARLIGEAPRLLRILSDLVEWSVFTGGWDAPCWQEARALLAELQASSPATGTEEGGPGTPPNPGGAT